MPDADAFDALDVPVVWCNSQGQVLGANPAFEAQTGHPLATASACALVDLLGLAGEPGQSALLGQLRRGEEFARLRFSGRRAGGQALTGRMSLRHWAGQALITLQIDDLALLEDTAERGREAHQRALALAQRLEMATWAARCRCAAPQARAAVLSSTCPPQRPGRPPPPAWVF